jgi:UDP-glucose 4-epimerase
MRILVTGGAGFIGYHLCKKLLEKHSLVIVDNLSNGNGQNILDLKGDFVFNCMDINHVDFDNILKIERINVIFHFAANSDISNPDPYIDFWNTFHTTYTILQGCKKYGIKQLVFASSSAIYGEQSVDISESTGNLFPVSHYGAAKLSSEAFISSYSYQYNIQSWICRFPNVTGQRLTHGVVHDFKNKLAAGDVLEVLGDGEQCKPFIYVEDLVSAILFIWKNAKEQLNVFNIGASDTIKVKEIAQMMSKKIKYTGESWKGDVQHYDFDTSKLSALGWTNIRSSKEAIKLSL